MGAASSGEGVNAIPIDEARTDATFESLAAEAAAADGLSNSASAAAHDAGAGDVVAGPRLDAWAAWGSHCSFVTDLLSTYGVPAWEVTPEERELVARRLADVLIIHYPNGPSAGDDRVMPYVWLLLALASVAGKRFDVEKFAFRHPWLREKKAEKPTQSVAPAKSAPGNVMLPT